MHLSQIKYNEQWRVWVSTEGRIYRKLGENNFVEYSRSVTNSGYYQIGLTIDGKPGARLVHRLVAETFLDNPKNLRDVDHINANKLDNRLENLRFASHSFNCARNHRKMSDEHKVALTISAIEAHLGKVWYTDGVKNVIGEPDKCPEGFRPGLTKSPKGMGHCKRVPAVE